MIKVRYIATAYTEAAGDQDYFFLGELPFVPTDQSGGTSIYIEEVQYSVSDCVLRNNEALIDLHVYPLNEDNEIGEEMLTQMRMMGWTLRKDKEKAIT